MIFGTGVVPIELARAYISSMDTTTKFSIVLRKIFSSPLLGWWSCVIGVTVVLYWRRPDAFYNPQLWAEDGSRFFSSAFSRESRSLFFPYAGYFHILARLIAWIGSWLPVRYVPQWYTFASWVFLVCILGYIFSARFTWHWSTKFLMGLALVVTTVDNEVFFNLSNWATLSSFFWLLLSVSNEPQFKRQRLFDILLMILTGLNSPFAICLWPLFLLRWGISRTSHNVSLFGTSLIVAILQVWNMSARINDGGVFPEITPVFADAAIYRFGF